VGKLNLEKNNYSTPTPRKTMKTELKAKFLQHLTNKRKDEGFTLIELLVVIIIIGILSAIALPSFLNQASKAKQSEAKTTVGSVNSAQNAYRTENSGFATDLASLSLGLKENSQNYTYVVTGATNTASIIATNKDTALKGYTGANVTFTDANTQSAVATIVCEDKQADATDPVAPTLSTGVTTAALAAKCDAASQKQL